MSKPGNRRTCAGTTVGGERCRSPVVGLDNLCDAHRTGGLEVVRRRATAGGKMTGQLYAAGLYDLPALTSPEAAQQWLERTGRAVALKKISGSGAGAIVSVVRQWLAAYEQGEAADRIARIEDRIEELREAQALP